MAIAVVWFRRDLRLHDHPALAYAIQSGLAVLPLYIHDESTLFLGAAQKWWLHHALTDLDVSLRARGLKLMRQQGEAKAVFEALLKAHAVKMVCWHTVYEPKQLAQDKIVKQQLSASAIDCQVFHEGLLVKPHRLLNQQGAPFKVFTPFWRKALSVIDTGPVIRLPKASKLARFTTASLESWQLLPKKPNWAAGFSAVWSPTEAAAKKRCQQFLQSDIAAYSQGRDYPALGATSGLSPYLHFGQISVRRLWHACQALRAEEPRLEHAISVYLSELGWREFCHYLLYHFPHLPTENFNPKFNAFPWQHNQASLEAWQQGETGYPLVDAGMRQLHQTGYMHNRVRMVVGSFLTKHLRIDWREGERFFETYLLDADLANNVGGWQWVAGCGVDAAPYFRIFNPVLQGEKFDAEGDYVRQWLPVLADLPRRYVHQPWAASQTILAAAKVVLGENYPLPMVVHAKARESALAAYQKIK